MIHIRSGMRQSYVWSSTVLALAALATVQTVGAVGVSEARYARPSHGIDRGEWFRGRYQLGYGAGDLTLLQTRGDKIKTPPAVNPRKLGYTLTFGDEFDGTTLDRSKWIDSYPDDVRTHSNNEQQYYAPDGYEVRNGLLRLKAERRRRGGMPYTSGIVTTYGKFAQKYGWFEIRARFPRGKGMWPAFWLLPDDKSWPPEIDILEILGHEPDKVYLTNHYKLADGKHGSKGDSYSGPDFSTGYHTFAVEWKPDEILWYVDGIVRYRTRQHVPAVPMYVLANLAVGGDWPGNPDATTPFPGNMDIDYIRVYSKNGSR